MNDAILIFLLLLIVGGLFLGRAITGWWFRIPEQIKNQEYQIKLLKQLVQVMGAQPWNTLPRVIDSSPMPEEKTSTTVTFLGTVKGEEL